MPEFLSSKREKLLETDSSHKNNKLDELNDPLTPFVCSISDGTRADFRNTDHFVPI